MPRSSRKQSSILLRFQGESLALELVPAAKWAAKFPSLDLEGLFRVRIGDAWHMPSGRRYAFLSLGEVGELAARRMAMGLGLGEDATEVSGFAVAPVSELPEPPPCPAWAHKGARCLGPFRDEEGAGCGRSFIASPPFQGPDRRWRVFLAGEEEPTLVELLGPYSQRRVFIAESA